MYTLGTQFFYTSVLGIIKLKSYFHGKLELEKVLKHVKQVSELINIMENVLLSTYRDQIYEYKGP